MTIEEIEAQADQFLIWFNAALRTQHEELQAKLGAVMQSIEDCSASDHIKLAIGNNVIAQMEKIAEKYV